MDEEQKKRPDSLEDLRKDIADNMPMLVSRAQLRDIITPLIDEVKQTVIDVMPIMPKALDTEALTKDIAGAVKDSVVIEHTTVENTTIQEMAIPAEVVELLKLQSRAITLLKNQPKPTSLADYKPHDQETVKGTKISYFGFADPSGKWYILCQNGLKKTQRYAAGDSGYLEGWKARETHKYSYLSEVLNG